MTGSIFKLSTLALLFISAGCVNLRLHNEFSIDKNDWYTEGGSTLRQNQISTQIDPPLVEKWRYDAGAGVGLAGALVVDNVVLIGTRKGHVLALDLETGKRVGRGRYDVPIEGGMAVNRSILFLPLLSRKKSVVAHDFSRGENMWKLEGAPVEAGILALEDRIIAVDVDGKARAVSIADGSILWEKSLTDKNGVIASPLAIENTIVVAHEGGGVHALDEKSGDKIWSIKLRSPVHATMSSDGEAVFVSTTRGRLHAIEGKSGKKLWSYALADTTVRLASPGYDITDDQVVFGSTDGTIRAIDAKDGSEKWTTAVEGAVIIAPLFTENVIYIGTLRGKLYAISRMSGQILWEKELTGRIKSAISAQDQKIIVMAETQQVFMFASDIPSAEVSE